uniref:Forkhead box H1 n=1 Tax=Pelusios castaneus TaxID=367368 RepID=A0A8C8REU3_9SAUR
MSRPAQAAPQQEPAAGAGQDQEPEDGSGEEEEEEEAAGRKVRRRKKKKKYNRHPKPPYTYLAMIALVIQASPGRKLKLSQIIQEIGALFPFFTEGYQGWKDSIRHNLSSNSCFAKLLKDPAKPKAKGNFWTVDVSRIPPDALKLQNTAISRQEAASFASDLSPFILHGWPYEPPPSQPSEDSLPVSIDLWGPVPIFRVSSGPPSLPWRPPCALAVPRSSSSSSSSLSSAERDPGSRWAKQVRGPRTPAKRPRLLATHESSQSSSDSDDSGGCTPAQSPPQLPTSYTKCVAPNVVAPSSGPPFFTFPTMPGLPCYGYAPLPGLSVDLDHMVPGMPPNKSVYDVWVSHPGDIMHPALYGQVPGPSSVALTRSDSL